MPAKREYIAVGPNCWGRGATVDEAYAAMKRELSTVHYHNNITFTTYDVAAGTEVNDLGGFRYPIMEPPPKLVHTGNAVIKRRPR